MSKLYRLIFILILVMVLFIPASSKANQKFDNVKTPSVVIGGKLIGVEIADKPETRKIGLMTRKYLAPDKGMLFIFQEPTKPVFWMKDCFISLDIIFIKDDKIINIYTSVPPCKVYPCELYPSIDYADKVLEVNGGFVLKNNVNVDDTVEFKGFRL